MLAPKVRQGFADALKEIKDAGLFKEEWVILTAQGADIRVKQGEVINFCANNYLGLANHPRLVAAAKEGLDKYGYGLSSVRFICGTQDVHKSLEAEISKFLGTDDTILYSSCFDANGGLFETILDKECVIISDALNHASIIDGIRLCKAERKVFKHADMADLEERLKDAKDAKRVFVQDVSRNIIRVLLKKGEPVEGAKAVDATTDSNRGPGATPPRSPRNPRRRIPIQR